MLEFGNKEVIISFCARITLGPQDVAYCSALGGGHTHIMMPPTLSSCFCTKLHNLEFAMLPIVGSTPFDVSWISLTAADGNLVS